MGDDVFLLRALRFLSLNPLQKELPLELVQKIILAQEVFMLALVMCAACPTSVIKFGHLLGSFMEPGSP